MEYTNSSQGTVRCPGAPGRAALDWSVRGRFPDLEKGNARLHSRALPLATRGLHLHIHILQPVVVGGAAPCSNPRQGPVPGPSTGALPQTPPLASEAGGATALGSHPSVAIMCCSTPVKGCPPGRTRAAYCPLTFVLALRVTNFCSCILTV